ncbi:hypothetical protein GCM10008940_21760 [Microbulbifer agarilyticus]
MLYEQLVQPPGAEYCLWGSEVVMHVSAFDANGEKVFHTDLTMRILPKKE